MPKTFFITTAIDYTNSPPHIGHAYEKVLADVLARYHRLKGENVFFLNRRRSARPKGPAIGSESGRPSSRIRQRRSHRSLSISGKSWMSDTTNGPRRRTIDTKNVVQGILQRLFDEGQIYKDKQAGYYSVVRNNS